jgi:hypothetical protein
MTSPPLPIDDEQLFHDRLFGRMLTSAWRGCDGCRRIALETAPPERACLEPPRRKIRDVLRLKAGRLRPEWEAIWGRGRLNFHGPAPFDRYKTGDDSRKPKIALAQSPALLAHRRCQSSQNRTFPGSPSSPSEYRSRTLGLPLRHQCPTPAFLPPCSSHTMMAFCLNPARRGADEFYTIRVLRRPAGHRPIGRPDSSAGRPEK